MSVASLSNREIVVMTAPLIADRYGSDVIQDWDHPTVRTLMARVSQTASLITNDHRVQVSTNTTIVIDGDPGITAYDRIEIDGDTFVVDGEPHLADAMRGPHHTEIALRRVVG